MDRDTQDATGVKRDRIKGYILTEENLEELVRLTNEELAQTCGEEREKLELLQDQIAEVDSRLGKLYDALETGEFESGQLAPRIQALFQKKEELQQAKAEAEEALRCEAVEIADPQVVRDYANDLRGLLERSSIIEQRSFLKSFVERIEVDDSEVKVYYTISMPPSSMSEESRSFTFRTPRLKERGIKGVRLIKQSHQIGGNGEKWKKWLYRFSKARGIGLWD